MTRRIAVLILFVFFAAFAYAEGTQPVLTEDGVVYTVDPESEDRLVLVKRMGDERESVVVPTTEDAERESGARLLWDPASSTLYVLWHRSGSRADQILLARMYADGTWSDATIIATGSSQTRVGLVAAMTKAKTGDTSTATLIHAAWWTMKAEPVAEYALVAFENGEHVSTSTADLAELAGLTGSGVELEIELMADVEHPPLSMAGGSGATVDIVFGSAKSTMLTRVVVDPKLVGNARLWKPSRKGGKTTPRAMLQSVDGQPVQTILSRDRIVLYTPNKKFRFVIFDSGRWTPERMIQLDENLTSEQVVQELRRTVEQLGDDQPADVIE